MNYLLPSIKLNYGDYMTPSHLFYPKIWRMPTEDHELERKQIIDFGTSLTLAKKSIWHWKICSNKNIVVQKVYKGNSVILVNRADCVKRIKELLSDVSSKRLLLNLEINIALQYGGILIDFLKQVKNHITTDLYKDLFAQGSQPGNNVEIL